MKRRQNGRKTASIDKFAVTDVRCFEGEQQAVVRPITLLVGENSTGKTSFLGCFRVVSELLNRHWLFDGPRRLSFNQEPFLMGSFRDIVRSRRGRAGLINEFRLGVTVLPPRWTELDPYSISFTFSERAGQATVTSYRLQFTEQHFLEVDFDASGPDWISIPGHRIPSNLPSGLPIDSLLRRLARGRWYNSEETQDMKPLFLFLCELMTLRSSSADQDSLNDLEDFVSAIIPGMARPSLIAPLRSKPKRTYDPVGESASPEGEHIPMLLMRLHRTTKDEWDSLHDDLVAFGTHSGLFSDIKVKGHGQQMSDPFQLQVKVRSGSHANIMDVGYGVSQSLPILVDLMSKKITKQTFLLQQPEVHLHPRGQAELASLFVQSWKKRKQRFLIETHSDHVVDRVRIAVRCGEVKPDDVSILYFEPNRNSVQIHSLGLDRQGNLQNSPPGYRDFFLHETDRLLGFRDD